MSSGSLPPTICPTWRSSASSRGAVCVGELAAQVDGLGACGCQLDRRAVCVGELAAQVDGLGACGCQLDRGAARPCRYRRRPSWRPDRCRRSRTAAGGSEASASSSSDSPFWAAVSAMVGHDDSASAVLPSTRFIDQSPHADHGGTRRRHRTSARRTARVSTSWHVHSLPVRLWITAVAQSSRAARRWRVCRSLACRRALLEPSNRAPALEAEGPQVVADDDAAHDHVGLRRWASRSISTRRRGAGSSRSASSTKNRLVVALEPRSCPPHRARRPAPRRSRRRSCTRAR